MTLSVTVMMVEASGWVLVSQNGGYGEVMGTDVE